MPARNAEGVGHGVSVVLVVEAAPTAGAMAVDHPAEVTIVGHRTVVVGAQVLIDLVAGVLRVVEV